MTYTIFVSGPLHNPLNGSRGHWSKHARWSRQWRDRTGMAWLVAYPRPHGIAPRAPKLVRFLANTGATWDDDNLAAGMKPMRDALCDLGVIHSDAPSSGHRFEYGQRIDRKRRGVLITVEPLP